MDDLVKREDFVHTINKVPLVEKIVKLKLFTSFVLLTLLLGMAACSQKGTTLSNFKLIILRENWFDLNIGYDAEPAQAALRSADTSAPLFVIGIDQVEEYDWDLQTITLTEQGTKQLVEALASIEGTDPGEIAKLKDLKESLGWGNTIESALYIHPFTVQADNRFMYGRIFLDATSQRPINFPVIRVTISDGKAILALLPTQIPFVTIDPVDGSGNMRTPAIAPEAEKDVSASIQLLEMITRFATSETSIEFRAIIRDETIESIFETAGKLKVR